jgi:hypothetical protein
MSYRFRLPKSTRFASLNTIILGIPGTRGRTGRLGLASSNLAKPDWRYSRVRGPPIIFDGDDQNDLIRGLVTLAVPMRGQVHNPNVHFRGGDCGLWSEPSTAAYWTADTVCSPAAAMTSPSINSRASGSLRPPLPAVAPYWATTFPDWATTFPAKATAGKGDIR